MLHGHLVGLYEKALPAEWDWTTRLQTAKQLGFDYLEISIDETDERISRLFWNKSERLELLLTSKIAGVPIRSMCLSAHRRFPFGSADAAIKKKAYEIMEAAILFAKDIGISVIQLAGYDVYYEPSTQKSAGEFLEGLKWAAKLAEHHQVMLAMEIMDTPFLNSITKHLWYEKEINSPWYRVYPDLGNLTAWGNNVSEELEKGIASIVAVHIKDTRSVTGEYKGQFKSVPFGYGNVDFVQCFAKLEELKYQGPYLVEMWSTGIEEDVNAIKTAMNFINEKYNLAVAGISK